MSFTYSTGSLASFTRCRISSDSHFRSASAKIAVACSSNSRDRNGEVIGYRMPPSGAAIVSMCFTLAAYSKSQ